MSHLTFSPAAAADLETIWDYTAENWGLDQADAYTDDIRDLCLALASGEKHGHQVDLRGGYLKHRVGRHIVFFRQSEGEITVVRILHQRMDVGLHL